MFPRCTLRQADSFLKIVVIALILIGSASCKKDQKPKTAIPAPVLSPDKEITSFSFKVAYNHVFTDEVIGEIKGDTIYCPVFAATSSISALIPQFSFTGAKVTINGTIQESNITTNDYSAPLTYVVTAEDKSTKSYVVKVTDNGISTIYLTTDGGVAISSKEDYVTGSVKVVSNFTKVGYNGKTQVKGHGNSTWFDMPKKPYKIKLDKKSIILGMPEGKNWILLANYADKSLMRNELAFNLSRTFGRQFTVASRFVELYLNGEYQGNYQITQEVKQGTGLVDVEDQDATTTTLPDLSGGYMIEEDLFAYGNPVYFYTSRQMGFDIEYPDDDVINQQQKDYITNHFQKLEDALFADNFVDPVNGYRKYFDVDTYVDYYLVSEIIGNPDVFRSTYLFKKRNDDHIYTGPNWDYDKAANNDNRLGDQVNGLMLNSAFGPQTWINRLMQDPTFRQKVRSRWNQMKSKVTSLPTVVDAISKQLAVSEIHNFNKWQIIGHQSYLEVYVGQSYQDEVSYLRTFLTNHIAWLDQKFNSTDYQ